MLRVFLLDLSRVTRLWVQPTGNKLHLPPHSFPTRANLEIESMNLTIEIPDDRAAWFRKVAERRGLTVDRWMLEVAEESARTAGEAAFRPALAEVFAKVRGLADDVDFSRDPSPGRDVAL